METSTPESRSTGNSAPVNFSISEDAAVSEFFSSNAVGNVSTMNAGWQRGISPLSVQSGATEGSRKRISQCLATDFIRAETLADDGTGPSAFRSTHDVAWFCQANLKAVFKSRHFNHFMALVVVVDAVCNCYDIDARAAGLETLTVLMVVSYACLVLYTFELLMNFLFQGVMKALRNNMIKLDVFLIVCGYTELLFDVAMPGTGFSRVSLLRMLRLMRVFRLLKIFRKVKALRELNKLVKMMSTCMKALLWSFCFCFMVMTVWAMLVVEVVHPHVKEMNDELFEACDDCLLSTSSVLNANLLLFKTVIAGDSWGQVAVPVIRAHPYTALIFMGAYLTIVFGVLNLIVAVVVDTFADARERDVLNLAEEMESDQKNDQKYLQKIFDNIDFDGSGELTFEQLLQGARKNAEFQSRLRVMDIDEGDLKELFHMIDIDGSGTIEPNEFIRPLSRWVHDSKTAPRFIKYNMMRCIHQQEELQQVMEITFQNLSARLEELSKNVKMALQEGVTPKSSPLVLSTCASRASREVDEPPPSLPVNLKEAREGREERPEAAASARHLAVQQLRDALSAATELALETCMATIDQHLPPEIPESHGESPQVEDCAFEAVETIRPSAPVLPLSFHAMKVRHGDAQCELKLGASAREKKDRTSPSTGALTDGKLP